MSGVPIFANGAQTAAIQYLFNQAASSRDRSCGGRPCVNRPQGEDSFDIEKASITLAFTSKVPGGPGIKTEYILKYDGVYVFNGVGYVSGSSIALTADYNFELVGNSETLSDYGIKGKFSATSSVVGIFGGRASGSIGSEGGNVKVSVGIVTGSSISKPVSGVTTRLFGF